MSDDTTKEAIAAWLAQGNHIKTGDELCLEVRATRNGSSTQFTTHIHTWEPLSNARYRCAGCSALGYRRVAAIDMEDAGVNSRILEYTCAVTNCSGWATGKDWTRPNQRGSHQFRCPDHRIRR